MTTPSATDSVQPDIQPPEPELPFTEMLHRAEAMRTSLRERQQHCEELGRLPEETHRDFLGAGFYRILQPRCFGGYEFSLTDFTRLVLEISRGCIDSGWVLSLIGSQPPFLSSFSDRAQREAYGLNGDCRAAMVIKPGGSALPADGGYRVQGAWDYCSGCDIATHLAAGILLRDSLTQPPKGMAYVLFDREHYEIVDNWNMMGMQGTGSRRVVVAEHVIPAHRLASMTADVGSESGQQRRRSPYADGTPSAAAGFAACAVAVGAARGALDIYEGLLRNKKWIIPPFPFRFEMPEMQQSFGGAQALVDTAEAALLALADQSTERCRMAHHQGVSFAEKDARRIHRAGLQCVELAWQAVDLMFRTGGTSSGSRHALLGRYFRGLAVLRTHIGLQYDHVSMNVTRLHFGLPALSPL